ncbi:MAG TPA: zinc-dependent metalloprotease [Gemmatimonadaceae bacterium]|nr:zinc-dependent metalloprotease [Gemmatimonadaceae bacterium]
MPRTARALLALSSIAVASCAAPRGGSAATVTPQPTSTARAATDTARTTIAAKTSGMLRRAGFIPLDIDTTTGKLYLEIPRDSMRVLYFLSLATGFGSNPLGLDRGSEQGEYVAHFARAGDRMLLVLENWNYRSSATNNPAHVRTVAEAFPPSTVAAMPILASEDGRFLVDATDFVYHDWSNVAATMARSNQGSYAIARDRSSIYRPYTKAFPENTEIDVSLTFALSGGRPGRIASTILPDARAFTLRQHMSFLQLPDSGYHPRAFDPRVGFFGITFKDYAQPIQGSLDQRWIARHRLERMNPADPTSPIKNPIVYYIDRGIPEPIRTAVKQGVSWWSEAFDRAGLKGAFVVKDLPEGVDPMDARYNVVQWENRNERGWSIGGSLGDPRTGEIIKGMARLDSHRERTDYNLYAGLMGAASSSADTAFVLARARSKAAHEVGHTLGLAHNFIASTYGRGSVMDYPPPRATLDANGNIDVSDAYAQGTGAYDIWAIHWGYGIFPPGTEQDSLRAILADGLKKGYLFLSDADARPDFASDPRVNLWDDQATAAGFLRTQMAVRRVAMQRFGLRNIRAGEPVALLQERFVPVYFMHRYALSSAARTIGGMEYSNAVSGDGQQATRPIGGAQQRAVLQLFLAALQPRELAIPDTVLTLLAPRPFMYAASPELFGSRTRPAFDELGAARSLAQMILDDLLQRDRAARLVQFAPHLPHALTLTDVIDSLTAATWNRPAPSSPTLAALQRVTQRALADRLIALAADTQASPEVRAIAELHLTRLRATANARARVHGTTAWADATQAHWLAIAGEITRWLERRELPTPTPALTPPPFDPFGGEP